MKLFTFNPETDFALAADSPSFTPTKRVKQMRSELRFVQSVFASPGDIFYVPDSDELFFVMKGKGSFEPCKPDLGLVNEVRPWGWNRAIYCELLRNGVSREVLPSEAQLKTWRELSHRRTAGRLLEVMGLPNLKARECFSLEQYNKVAAEIGAHYIKAPWSSSGRGVFYSEEYPTEKLTQIVDGALRRQGSVMIEPKFPGCQDFATEWYVSDSEIRYIGLSMFETLDGRQYNGNVMRSQTELTERFNRLSDTPLTDIIEMQRSALAQIIAPHYEGPAGLDMMVSEDGQVHPCVEINLRTTMGMVAIASQIS